MRKTNKKREAEEVDAKKAKEAETRQKAEDVEVKTAK